MLTDIDCRTATCPPDAKRRRLTDASGLYLEVSPTGAKRWFWKFYGDGKESRLALGSYPAVSLKAARLARDKARQVHQSGTNPAQHRRAEKIMARQASAVTFEAVAREFHAQKSTGWSPRYGQKWLERMEKDLFPAIGSLALASITAPVLLSMLNKVERRSVETAHALRQTAGVVFAYGIQTGRCERNPADDMRGALKPKLGRNMPALLDPVKVGQMLRAFDRYNGQATTRVALILSALLFQRPGNVRMMEWAEIDVGAAMWTIPAMKMKRTLHGKINGRPHLVPLAPQALALLDELRPLTGGAMYVFPSLLSHLSPMSENTVRAALRRLDYSNDEMTPHGFRAMARTMIVERLPGVNPDVIEAQLAHVKSGPLGSAYDRAEFLEQRRAMMNAWADYLDALRAG